MPSRSPESRPPRPTRAGRPPAVEPEEVEARTPLRAPEITESECRRCGTLIAGLDGRYACGVCGWVNDHSEGHHRLPRADEDPDRPRVRRRRPPTSATPPAPPSTGT
ncbi:hypothetical protein ACN20G_19570 [Streptomyces sp. BI20]|uniref:hypothetical protein n=1 Tax=Streptomyces sp. BI20 TaxID=3403460 RepID=UPI003C776689